MLDLLMKISDHSLHIDKYKAFSYRELFNAFDKMSGEQKSYHNEGYIRIRIFKVIKNFLEKKDPLTISRAFRQYALSGALSKF